MRLVEQTKESFLNKSIIKEGVNLSKYFTRSKEDDFSDDGSRFYCWKYGPLRISKCTYQGGYFIAARPYYDGELTYDEYSQLPHYKDLDKYNTGDNFTDEDAVDLKNICDEYIKEYNAAVEGAEAPDNEEYLKYHREINNVAKEYYQKALEEIKKVDIAKMSPYDLREIQECLRDLKREAADIDEARLSQDKDSRKREVLRNKRPYNSYWYNHLLEKIKNICDEAEDNDPYDYNISYNWKHRDEKLRRQQENS